MTRIYEVEAKFDNIHLWLKGDKGIIIKSIIIQENKEYTNFLLKINGKSYSSEVLRIYFPNTEVDDLFKVIDFYDKSI